MPLSTAFPSGGLSSSRLSSAPSTPGWPTLVLGHRSEPLAGCHCRVNGRVPFTSGCQQITLCHLRPTPRAGLLFPSDQDRATHTGEVSCAQGCAVSIMTVELTQNPPPRDFSSPFLRREGRLVNSKPLSPGPPGRAIGEVPTFASAPKPIICPLGLTSSRWASLPLCEFPLPQKRRFSRLEAVCNSSLRWSSSREPVG